MQDRSSVRSKFEPPTASVDPAFLLQLYFENSLCFEGFFVVILYNILNFIFWWFLGGFIWVIFILTIINKNLENGLISDMMLPDKKNFWSNFSIFEILKKKRLRWITIFGYLYKCNWSLCSPLLSPTTSVSGFSSEMFSTDYDTFYF